MLKHALKRIGTLLPLLTLGVALVVSDPWFTHVDDEVAIIAMAAQPVRHTIDLFLHGVGQHEHPPLYDVLLHGWLRLTAGEMRLLRLPSIFFFLGGLWILAQAAGRMAGPPGAKTLLWMGALWPFGFHFSRLAAWYSFSFFLVALLTLAYLDYVQEPRAYRWLFLWVVSVALVYTNYFGWALLGCLAIDFCLRHRPVAPRQLGTILGTGALVLAAYFPVLPAFYTEVVRGVGLKRSLLSTVFNLGFSFYSLFASESVAPWFWILSIPICLAVSVCIVCTVLFATPPARRFMVYYLLLNTTLVVLGLFTTKRLLLIAAWLLLPLAVTFATAQSRFVRRWLVAALCVVAGIGWMGILSRRFYAAPRFIEPWRQVAQEAAQKVNEGAVVIGNSSSFFFYLTYALHLDRVGPGRSFSGLLPFAVRDPRVYEPAQWRTAGQVIGSTTLLVKGLHFGSPAERTRYAEQWLNENCRLQQVRRMVWDSGSELKQRYFPELDQVPWRIESRAYACAGPRIVGGDPKGTSARD